MPQSLNRYAAMSMGAPGVAEAAQHLHPLTTTALKGTGKTLISTITDPVRKRTLNTAIHTLLTSTIGRSRPTGNSCILPTGEPKAFTRDWAKLSILRFDTYSLPPRGCLGFCNWLLRHSSTYQLETRAGLVASEALDDLPKNLGLLESEAQFVAPRWMKVAPRYLGAFIWGGVLSGAVQYGSDYDNPYLTQGQIWKRTGIATIGGGFTGFIGAAAASKIGGALGVPGGIPTMALGASIGFTLGFIYFGFFQPVIFQDEGLNPRQRNLAPFSSP